MVAPSKLALLAAGALIMTFALCSRKVTPQEARQIDAAAAKELRAYGLVSLGRTEEISGFFGDKSATYRVRAAGDSTAKPFDVSYNGNLKLTDANFKILNPYLKLIK